MFDGELNQPQCSRLLQLPKLNRTTRLDLQFQASALKLSHQSSEVWKKRGERNFATVTDIDSDDRQQET
jgi:hypothetical protein